MHTFDGCGSLVDAEQLKSVFSVFGTIEVVSIVVEVEEGRGVAGSWALLSFKHQKALKKALLELHSGSWMTPQVVTLLWRDPSIVSRQPAAVLSEILTVPHLFLSRN